jgi:uncharacterized short protein YbdD (DUF466 family)
MEVNIASTGSSPAVSARPLLARIDNLLCRIIGAPDYDKYVAHHRKHHPDEEPLSRKDFECRAYSDRYSRPGSRCC